MGTDGNIYRLEANRQQSPSNNKLTAQQIANNAKNLFLPNDAEMRNLAFLTDPPRTVEETEQQLIDPGKITGGKFGEYMQKKQQEAAAKYKK